MIKKMIRLASACAIMAMAFAVMLPVTASAAVAERGTCGTAKWEISTDGVFTVHAGTLSDDREGWPDTSQLINVKRVVITEKVKSGENCAFLFYDAQKVTSMNLSGLDTSRSTDLYGMFGHCMALKSIDLSNFNTSKVEYMNNMFMGCFSLTSANISSFDSTKALTTFGMFAGCSSLKKVTLGSKFSFVLQPGDGESLGFLPTQSFANANGKWYDSKTHVGYKPSELPAYTAATYYATTPASRHITAPKKGQKWTAKAGGALFSVKIKSTKKKSRTIVIKKMKKIIKKPKSSDLPAGTMSLASEGSSHGSSSASFAGSSESVSLMSGSSSSITGNAITISDVMEVYGRTYKVIGLDSRTFAGSSAVTVYINASRIKAIPVGCFQNCKNLRTVTLPQNITSIGAKAFYGCSSLTALRIQGKKIKAGYIGNKAFSKTYKKMKVYAPKKKLKAYKKAFRVRGLSKKAKFKKI